VSAEESHGANLIKQDTGFALESVSSVVEQRDTSYGDSSLREAAVFKNSQGQQVEEVIRDWDESSGYWEMSLNDGNEIPAGTKITDRTFSYVSRFGDRELDMNDGGNWKLSHVSTVDTYGHYTSYGQRTIDIHGHAHDANNDDTYSVTISYDWSNGQGGTNNIEDIIHIPLSNVDSSVKYLISQEMSRIDRESDGPFQVEKESVMYTVNEMGKEYDGYHVKINALDAAGTEMTFSINV